MEYSNTPPSLKIKGFFPWFTLCLPLYTRPSLKIKNPTAAPYLCFSSPHTLHHRLLHFRCRLRTISSQKQEDEREQEPDREISERFGPIIGKLCWKRTEIGASIATRYCPSAIARRKQLFISLCPKSTTCSILQESNEFFFGGLFFFLFGISRVSVVPSWCSLLNVSLSLSSLPKYSQEKKRINC